MPEHDLKQRSRMDSPVEARSSCQRGRGPQAHENVHSAYIPPRSWCLWLPFAAGRIQDPYPDHCECSAPIVHARIICFLSKGSQRRRGGCHCALSSFSQPLILPAHPPILPTALSEHQTSPHESEQDDTRNPRWCFLEVQQGEAMHADLRDERGDVDHGERTHRRQAQVVQSYTSSLSLFLALESRNRTYQRLRT